METVDLINAAPEWYAFNRSGFGRACCAPIETHPTHIHLTYTCMSPPTSAQDGVRALKARLQSPNPKVQLLALSLLEAVVKNGSGDVHALLGQRGFLEAVGALTAPADKPGHAEVMAAALKLLQECGLAFEGQPGPQFPPLQASSPVFSPPPAATATASPQPDPVQPPPATEPAAAAAGGGGDGDVAAGMAKLDRDLGVVEERVQQLLRLLPTAGPIGEDEALAEAVGFLESCQPRLVRVCLLVWLVGCLLVVFCLLHVLTLHHRRQPHTTTPYTTFNQIQEEVIEAGMEGALNEALLERALVLFDALDDALGKERERAGGGARAASSDGAAAGGPVEVGAGAGATDDLIDFGEDSKPPAPPAQPTTTSAAAAAAAASSDVFDLFGPSQGGLAGGSQQLPLPSAATASATDSAVLAEADRLLQGLDLDGQPSPPPPPPPTTAP